MPEISDAELRTLARYQNLGTPEEIQKKITDLEGDNRKYRQEEKPALEAKVTDLEKKLPEGAVVLTGDEAKTYPALKELGKPEEIKAKLEAGEKAESRLKEVDWENSAKAAAQALGWNGEALSKLPGARDHRFEVKTETKDGKDVHTVLVTPPGENQQPKKLEEYAPEHADWKPLLSAVTAKPDAGDRGRTYPRQSADGSPPRTTPSKDDHRTSVRTQVDYSI